MKGAGEMENSIVETNLQNRTLEKEIIANFLLRIKEGLSSNVEDRVLYLYGIGMIGKSTLLDWTHFVAAKENQIKSALVDFDREGKMPRRSQRSRLVGNCYDDESGRVQLAQDLYEQFTGGSLQTQEAEKVSTEFVHFANNSNEPLLIILDTIEDANQASFRWLQEEIIAPLLPTGKLGVIYAGLTKSENSKLYFPWAINRFLVTHHLRPFNENDTKIFNASLAPELIISYKDTYGVPGYIKKLVVENRKKEPAVPQLENKLGFVVENIILKPRQKQLALAVGKIKEYLRVAAIFRQFDDRLVENITRNPVLFNQNQSTDSGASLIREFLNTRLVEQHPDGYGYYIPHDVRRILDENLRETNLHKHFTICKEAFMWYRDEFQDGDAVSLADQIYYILEAWKDFNLDSSLQIPIGMPTYKSINNQGESLAKFLLDGIAKVKNYPKRHTLIGKISRVIDGEEFGWFLNQEEINLLKALCENNL